MDASLCLLVEHLTQTFKLTNAAGLSMWERDDPAFLGHSEVIGSPLKESVCFSNTLCVCLGKRVHAHLSPLMAFPGHLPDSMEGL